MREGITGVGRQSTASPIDARSLSPIPADGSLGGRKRPLPASDSFSKGGHQPGASSLPSGRSSHVRNTTYQTVCGVAFKFVSAGRACACTPTQTRRLCLVYVRTFWLCMTQLPPPPRSSSLIGFPLLLVGVLGFLLAICTHCLLLLASPPSHFSLCSLSLPLTFSFSFVCLPFAMTIFLFSAATLPSPDRGRRQRE
jgi:hypothetical protein